MRHARHGPFLATAALCVATAAIPAAFSRTMPDPRQLAGAFSAWSIALYLAAGLGTLLAANSFSRGEATRSGWLWLSGSYVLLVPTILWLGPKAEGLYAAPSRAEWFRAGSGLVSGGLAVGAFLLLARAWRKSGLDSTSRSARVVSGLAACGVAVLLAGGDLRERLPDALRGDVLASADVVTDVLDVAVFVVAVPVLRAALALGGGIAAWPWILLTASLASWLGYDATTVFVAGGSVDPRTVRVAEEVLRTAGAAFALAAGVAQRWVVIAARDR